MAQLPMKRAAPDHGTTGNAKRTQSSASEAPEDRTESAFDISVEMDEKFRAYPERLRQIIEDQYKNLIEQIMTKFEAGSPLQPRCTFIVTRKRLSDPPDRASDYRFPRETSFPAVSLANKEVLKEFLVKVPSKRPKFVEVKAPVANPKFAQLQSVRAGEIGWGFDIHKCLSLHMTTMDDCSLRHESIYVERKPMEAPNIKEDDDDCQVVEDPGATTG